MRKLNSASCCQSKKRAASLPQCLDVVVCFYNVLTFRSSTQLYPSAPIHSLHYCSSGLTENTPCCNIHFLMSITSNLMQQTENVLRNKQRPQGIEQLLACQPLTSDWSALVKLKIYISGYMQRRGNISKSVSV